MASKFLIVSFMCFKIVNCQYYGIPTPTANYFAPTGPAPQAPIVGPIYANVPPIPPIQSTLPTPPTSTKRSISSFPNPKCSPPAATAYYLSTPSDKVKATVIPKEKLLDIRKVSGKNSIVLPPTYSCPLCNNFADIPPNPKIPPPPSIDSPVLPGVIAEISSKGIPKDFILESVNEPFSIVSKKPPLFSDMYEKHKLPKNLSFDQELLEGFLTGLGIAL